MTINFLVLFDWFKKYVTRYFDKNNEFQSKYIHTSDACSLRKMQKKAEKAGVVKSTIAW